MATNTVLITAARRCRGHAAASSIVVAPCSPSMPSLLIGIRRDCAPFTASDDTRLERGDRLTLLVPAEHADQVTEHLQHRPSTDT